MSRYKTRQITYTDTDYAFDELITIAQAAKMLGLNVGTVRSMMNREKFTMVIDTQSHTTQQGFRLLIRSEVEAEMVRRAAKQHQ